jgi:hypothetical protein
MLVGGNLNELSAVCGETIVFFADYFSNFCRIVLDGAKQFTRHCFVCGYKK